MDDSDGGFWVVVILLALGVWWFFDNYEIVDKSESVELVEKYLEEATPVRPTGLLHVTTVSGGSTWSVDADTLRGPSTERLAWLVANHSKDKSISHRETQTLYEVNCDRGSYVTRKVLYYNKDGKAVQEWDDSVFSDTPDYAASGSNMAAVVERMCDPLFDETEK